MKNKQVKSAMLCMLISMSSISAYAAGSKDTGLLIEAGAGIGYSSNVYHSPSTSYVDLAAPGSPTVTPIVQSGMFIPMNVVADYKTRSGFDMGYKFGGDYFLGKTVSNANTYDHDVTLGKLSNFGRAASKSSFYVGVFAGVHRKLYVERDTGEEKVTRVGNNISNRYNYKDTGFEAEFKTTLSGMKFKVNASLATLTYDTPVGISSLTHSLNKFGGSVSIPVIGKTVKVKLGYDYKSRDYDFRHARGLDARLLRSNPLLSYTYQTLSGQISWKANRNLTLIADGEQLARTDKFAGYNDYTRNKVKFRARYKFSNDAFVRAKLSYSKTDYANAFAFENILAAKKTTNTAQASLKAAHHLSSLGEPTLWVKLDYKKVTANDLRYDYKLTEAALGGDWTF